MRVVISEKSGKSYQFELPKEKEANLIGKKIGDELDGNLIGAAGYVLTLTGGSDGSGFPMKKEVAGSAKKSTLTTYGVGFKSGEKGERRKKMVRGNTFSSEIVQVNTQVKTPGPTPLEQIFPKTEDKGKK
jgi:small subunit ribosomal protein S6e